MAPTNGAHRPNRLMAPKKDVSGIGPSRFWQCKKARKPGANRPNLQSPTRSRPRSQTIHCLCSDLLRASCALEGDLDSTFETKKPLSFV